MLVFPTIDDQVKHEILHALGFSAGLFAFYRNDDGVPLTPRSPIDNKPHYNDSLHLLVYLVSIPCTSLV